MADVHLIRIGVWTVAVQVAALAAVPPLAVAKLAALDRFARASWWGIFAPALAAFGVGLAIHVAVAVACVAMLVCDLDGRRLKTSSRGSMLGRPAQVKYFSSHV